MPSPEAYSRVLNAPASWGDLSGVLSVPYMMGGVGVGPGNQMILKDQAGIDAAARRMDAVLAQQRAANPFAGMIFGDSPGQVQAQVLGVQARRVAEAQQAANMARLQQQAIMENETRRQAQLLDAQLKQAQIAQQGAYQQAAVNQRNQDSQRDFIAQLASRVATPAQAQPGLDIQELLRGQAGARARMTETDAGTSNVYADMLAAARAEAAAYPDLGITVSSGTRDNPMPQIEFLNTQADPGQMAAALAAVQRAMQYNMPASSWSGAALPDLTGSSGETIPAGIDRLAILNQLRNQQAQAKADLATLGDVFKARGALGVSSSGSGSGGRAGTITPEMFQQLLQMQTGTPAPTRIGPMSQTALPLVTWDALQRGRPLTAADFPGAQLTPQDLARREQWYRNNPVGEWLSTDAGLARYVPQVPTVLAPAPVPVAPTYRYTGGQLVPVTTPATAAVAPGRPDMADPSLAGIGPLLKDARLAVQDLIWPPTATDLEWRARPDVDQWGHLKTPVDPAVTRAAGAEVATPEFQARVAAARGVVQSAATRSGTWVNPDVLSRVLPRLTDLSAKSLKAAIKLAKTLRDAPGAVPVTAESLVRAVKRDRSAPASPASTGSGKPVSVDPTAAINWLSQGTAPLGPGKPVSVDPMAAIDWLSQGTAPLGPGKPVSVDPMAAINWLSQGTAPLGPGKPVSVDPMTALEYLIQMLPDRERLKK